MATNPYPKRSVPVVAVRKAFDLLGILLFDPAAREGMRLSALAEQTGLPVNSVHNLLKTMRSCGFVSRNGDGSYAPGPMCRRIGADNYVTSDPFRQRLNATLQKYTALLQESLVFTVLSDGVRSVIARSEYAPRTIQVNLHALDQANIYRVATGRALLAAADNREFQAILAHNGDIDRHWPDYAADLRTIRRQGGYAGSQPGIREFAVAFRGGAGFGAVLCAIGCFAPRFRCSDSKAAVIMHTLKQLAADFSVPEPGLSHA